MFKVKHVLLFLYLAAVIASSFYSELKYKSLNFQTRDYAFYSEFSSRLLDSRMTKSYSLNPSGFNWLGYNGTEGAGNLHRALHFEPIKYVYALLYNFAGTPRVLLCFTSLVYFLPLIYLAFVVPLDTKEAKWFVTLIALLYVSYPASLLTPGFDLRPYVFLAPFFFMSLISVLFSRPLWERVLWFNCMFLAREEALILGASIILYALVMEDEPSLRKKTIISFSLAWLIWCLLTLGFFEWTGYQTSLFQTLAGVLSVLVLCVIILVALIVTYWQRLRGLVPFPRALKVAACCFVFVPLAFQFNRNESENISSPSLAWAIQTIFSPRYTLYFVALLGLVLVWRKSTVHAQAKADLLLLGPAIVVFLALGIFSSSGLPRVSARYLKEIPSARDVFSLREFTDKYQSWILVDYATHQALCDYQHVYVYNRLPWDMSPGEARYYPANKQTVQALVNERMEYIVVSKESAAVVNGFLSSSHRQSVRLFENERFVAIKIIRK